MCGRHSVLRCKSPRAQRHRRPSAVPARRHALHPPTPTSAGSRHPVATPSAPWHLGEGTPRPSRARSCGRPSASPSSGRASTWDDRLHRPPPPLRNDAGRRLRCAPSRRCHALCRREAAAGAAARPGHRGPRLGHDAQGISARARSAGHGRHPALPPGDGALSGLPRPAEHVRPLAVPARAALALENGYRPPPSSPRGMWTTRDEASGVKRCSSRRGSTASFS